MARSARVVIPAIAHYAAQRRNGRQPVFFCDNDYAVYLDLINTSGTNVPHYPRLAPLWWQNAAYTTLSDQGNPAWQLQRLNADVVSARTMCGHEIGDSSGNWKS